MASNQNPNPIVNVIIGAVLIAAGIALFVYWGKPSLEKSQASTNWPTVSGVVKTSRVTQSRGVQSGSTRNKNKNKTMYSPEVVFDYKVDGRQYASSKISMSSGWSSSESASSYRLVNKYPVGDAVTVAYDPADPAFAVLETGATWTTHFIYYLGPGLAVLGLLTVVGPLLKLMLVALYFGSSLTSAKPQPTYQSQFAEGESSPSHFGDSTERVMVTSAVDSSSASEISEGITVQ